MCFGCIDSVDIEITLKLSYLLYIYHAQTSLLDDCAFPPGRGERPLCTEFSHLIVLCIRCCVRATNTSVDTFDKHSIKCIACFDLHINSVNKQDTILNTQ